MRALPGFVTQWGLKPAARCGYPSSRNSTTSAHLPTSVNPAIPAGIEVFPALKADSSLSETATQVDRSLLATYVDNMESSQVAALATDTSDPRTGLRAVASLRVLADTLELRQVEAALRGGMGWQDIADALGVTRQAAHKKHSKRIDPTISTPRRNK